MQALEADPSWHGWLAAVIPADARRFRVADRELAAILVAAGAEVVDEAPDVEITAVEDLRGDAPYVVVRFGPRLADGDALLPRIGCRLAAFARAQIGALRARRALRSRGYRSVVVVRWDIEQVLRRPGARDRRPRLRMAERLPGAALVVGYRSHQAPTVLEAAAETAVRAVGQPAFELGWPMVRSSGVLVACFERLVLKVGVGAGRGEIERHCAGLELLRAADPPAVVAERAPRLYAHGEAGLGYWSLESRLDGDEPGALSDSLLADCLDFLVALHTCPHGDATETSLVGWANVVAQLCDAERARALAALADELERELAGLPHGIAHGDFWKGNLLAEDGRLRGVIDWSAAAETRPPLVDLFNLLVAERESRYFGRALLEFLLPWARAGGDDLSRSYCARLGIEICPERLEGLAIAWWLERVARELKTYGDRLRRPVWMYENVDSVVAALVGSGPQAGGVRR